MSLSRRELLSRTLGLTAAGGLLPFGGFAQQKPMKPSADRPLPLYRAPKVAPFSVNGNLEKSVWRAAPAVRLVAATGKPTRLQPTTLRVCWSETDLYVAFRCTDADARSPYTKRDEPLYEADVVEVFLSRPGDLSRYYELEFSPKNVIFDAEVNNPGLDRSDLQVETAWDCPGLQSAVRVHKATPRQRAYWTAEIAIPFAGLETEPPAVGTRWRANFYRIDYATPPEFSAWSPTLADPANYHLPARFGWLEFAGAAR